MRNIQIEFNKKLMIFLGIIILLVIVLKTIDINKNEKYNVQKIDKEKDFVYIKYHSDTNKSNIPYINLYSADANTVNNSIVEKAKDYLTSSTSTKTVNFRFNQSKNLLSVVVWYRDYINDKITYNYDTYVFDLKQNSKLLSDEKNSQIACGVIKI